MTRRAAPATGARRDRRSRVPEGGARSVDEHENVGRPLREPAARVVGGDLDADGCPARDDLFAHRRAGGGVALHLEEGGVDELGDELPALRGAALVEDDRGDVTDVRVDQAEEDELERGDQERKAHRPPVARHLHRFLSEDGAEAPHHGAATEALGGSKATSPRFPFSMSVKRTNTSSREAAIGRIFTLAPAAA